MVAMQLSGVFDLEGMEEMAKLGEGGGHHKDPRADLLVYYLQVGVTDVDVATLEAGAAAGLYSDRTTDGGGVNFAPGPGAGAAWGMPNGRSLDGGAGVGGGRDLRRSWSRGGRGAGWGRVAGWWHAAGWWSSSGRAAQRRRSRT